MQAGAAHPAVWSLDAGWATARSWTVLDTGFAAGHSLLDLWLHWRTQAERPPLLHYVGLLSAADASGLLEALRASAASPAAGLTPGPTAALAASLATQCYGLEPGFHRILLEDGQLSLTLCVGERAALLAQQDFCADTLLAEADAPGWDKWQLKALARCCRRGSQVLFGGAQWPSPQLLADAGFVLPLEAGAALPRVGTAPSSPTLPDAAARPGAAALRAIYNPRWQLRKGGRDPHNAVAVPGRCAVIGAGIAGASVARALALRGWQVDVFDAAAQAAGGASGLPVGLVVPHHSVDDSPRSRMSRGGTRLMLQHARALLRAAQDWNPGGVLELRVAEAGLAGEEVELLSRTAADAAGQAPGNGAGGDGTATAWASPASWGSTPGLWHPFAAWIKPALLVRAWLEHARIRFHGLAAVHTLRRQGPQWQLCAADGSVLGGADTVVFANAHGCAELLGRLATELPGSFPWVAGVLDKLQSLQALQGTLSLGPCTAPAERVIPDSPYPPYPVNGHGSFVPCVPTAHGPHWFAGSTFRSDTSQHADLAQEHASNLHKLQALLPAVAQSLAPQFEQGQVRAWQGERCVTYDRLPLVGPLEEGDAPTLWLCAGMGARGLSFSALCAELLAAELGAEPLPLESNLARALGTRRRQRSRAPVGAATKGEASD